MRRAFEIIYDPEVAEHLRAIERKYYKLIERSIVEQLMHEPEVETMNRKPLHRPSVFGTAWELRFGPDNRFRVFYQTDEANHEVHILAIGVKTAGQLMIGAERFEL